MPSRFTLLLALAAVVAACGSTPSSTPAPTATALPSATPGTGSADPAPSAGGPVTDPSVLAGRTFLSTAIAGRDLAPGSQVRLTFGNTLGASAGCNSMGGSYSVADGTLHVGRMAITEMACERPLMDQDTWLAGSLDGAAMTFDGTTLTLAKDGVTLTLMDEQAAIPDAPLEGTTWVVDTLIRDQTATSVPAGLSASLVFSDGRVAANTGCNRGNGSASIAADAITFGPMALTRMACPEPAMDLESFVTGVLEGEVAYTVDGDVLHLLGAGGGLDLRAQQR
jgi:heat shock protein HslJ